MIVVYTGLQPQTTFEVAGSAHLFRPHVPTWVPESYRTAIEERQDYVEWRAKMPTKSAKIYVGLSSALHLFIAAQFVLDKIRRVFPSCTIEVTCPVAFAALLPSHVQRIEYRDARTDYYRQFQCTLQAVPNNNDPYIERLVGWQRLMLIAAGLWEPRGDQADHGWIMPGRQSSDARDVVIVSGADSATLIQGLAEALTPLLSNPTTLVFDLNRVAELIEAIRSAAVVIHCGDSPLCYLSAALGIRTLTLRNRRWTKDLWDQYSHFPNVEPIEIGDIDTVESLAKHIETMVSTIRRPRVVPQAMRHSADLITDERPISEDIAVVQQEMMRDRPRRHSRHQREHSE